MRLSDYCTVQDVDRAIAVTVESFVGAQKVSCKKALARAFAKYVHPSFPPLLIFQHYNVILMEETWAVGVEYEAGVLL